MKSPSHWFTVLFLVISSPAGYAQIVPLGGGDYLVQLHPSTAKITAGRDRPGTPLLHLDMSTLPAFTGGFLIDSIEAVPAGPSFTFDSTTQGWFSEPEESLAATFQLSGIDGGSLRVNTTTNSPYDSFSLERNYDSAWSAVQGFYSSINFRIRFDDPAQAPRAIDFLIDDGTQAARYNTP